MEGKKKVLVRSKYDANFKAEVLKTVANGQGVGINLKKNNP
jgi:hypothetical protein